MRTLMIVDMASQEMMTVQPQQQQQLGCHSLVPYLFGGLAAMLGLIAFALLILACSYWKLSGYLQGANSREDGSDGDVESGDGKPQEAAVKFVPLWEEKIVVIMAGDEKPTFLATPMSSSASSFNDNKDNKNKGVDLDGEDGSSDKKVEECHHKVVSVSEQEHSYDERMQANKSMQTLEKS